MSRRGRGEPRRRFLKRSQACQGGCDTDHLLLYRFEAFLVRGRLLLRLLRSWRLSKRFVLLDDSLLKSSGPTT